MIKMPESFKTKKPNKKEESVKKEKPPKLIRVYDDFFDTEDAECPPSKFYILDAIGIVFVKAINREKAQKIVDDEYGKGKYVIRCCKITGNRDNLSVRATATRKGQKKYN